MIEKLIDRLVPTPPLRGVYQVFASLCAIATVAAWFGLGRPAFGHADAGDGRLLALQGSPLAVLYRALAFLDIPHEWVTTAAGYLAASPDRATAIAAVAMLLGLFVTMMLSPTPNVPSLQASTWWVCVTVAAQCSDGGAVSTMVVWLPVWLIGRAWHQRDAAKAVEGLVQLIFAALGAPLAVLPLILHNYRGTA